MGACSPSDTALVPNPPGDARRASSVPSCSQRLACAPRTDPSVPGQSSPGGPRVPPGPSATSCRMVLSHRGSAQGPTLHPHGSVVNGHSADAGWDPAPGHSLAMGKLPGGFCCTPGSTTALGTRMCPVHQDGPCAGCRILHSWGPSPSLPLLAPLCSSHVGRAGAQGAQHPPGVPSIHEPAAHRQVPPSSRLAKTSHARDFSIPHRHRGSVQDGQGTAPQAP